MPVKKKTEDSHETIATKTPTKTPRKRATKTVVESEVVANDSVIVANEVVEAKEVNETTNDKLIEDAETAISANTEVTQSNNLETIEATADNQQTSITDLVGKDSENGSKKKWKKGEHSDDRVAKKDIDVQKKFYERVINEKLEVSIQLGKLKIDGIITYEDSYSMLVKTKFGEQFLYKQGISYISAKKPFIKRPFVKRDRPFNNRENNDNQTATGQEDSANRPRFTRTPRENSNIAQTETTQQASEQPIRRPNEAKTFNRYQNQPPKTQSKTQPQKDTREVKVYKIVCAPPVKPKK